MHVLFIYSAKTFKSFPSAVKLKFLKSLRFGLQIVKLIKTSNDKAL